MKNFFLRIRTFWAMYLVFIIGFIVSLLFIQNIANEYLMYAVIFLVAILLIALSILSIKLPPEHKLYSALLVFNKISKALFIAFIVIYKRYGIIGKKEKDWYK